MIPLFFAIAALLLLTLALLLWPMMRRDNKQAMCIAVVVSVMSLGLYAIWGSPRVVPLADLHQSQMRGLYKIVSENSKIIKTNPDDVEAWLRLSQAFSDIGDYAAAVNGFKQAVLASKGHPRIIAAYSEALIMQAGGEVTPQAKKSLDIALMMDKEMPIARYYQAVWLLQQERNDEAMAMMKKLYHELPEDSSLKKRMKEQIGR